MPNIIKTAGENGIQLTAIELKSIGVHPGQRMKIGKWQPPISNDQRAMLFSYYGYCLDHGLRELGHFSIDGLHEDVKAWVNSTHPGDFGGNISITRMNKVVFNEFWKLIDFELIQGCLNVDTGPFWVEYEQWKNSGTEEKFREWKCLTEGNR
jgi:hypothetical protein